MKNKINQLFRDKLVLVMMVLGLLTIVAAAGAVKIRKGDAENQQNPYLEAPETQGILAQEVPQNRVEKEAGKEPTEAQIAGSSNASYSPEDKKENAAAQEAEAAGSGKEAAQAITLDYNGTDKLGWPIRGNVILDYSMETTTYFPTLDQYKCNPALIIQGDVSAPVSAPAEARIAQIGFNEEIGNYLVLDLGGDYTAVCGQLKDIQVAENQYVSPGTTLGYVAEPTKYYSIEGNNIYFELRRGETPVDALDYLE